MTTRLLSAFSGILIAVMILVNGTLAQYTGNILSNAIIHFSGLVIVCCLLLASRQKLHPAKRLPIYFYYIGAIGFIAILLNNWTFSNLGVTLTLTLGLLGQAIASIVIDHFGWFGAKKIHFNPKKLIGLCMFLIGIFVMNQS